MEHQPLQLQIAFYGDDFTGSTDALESLNVYGLKTILFIDVPSIDKLRQYEGLQAIGIAGMSRSLAPDGMDNELGTAFEALNKLSPRHVHYKVCSTFDSSPETGSIGRAIDIGVRVFNTKLVPLLVAAPVLGRYCLFGNLFARMGIGSNGAIFRLDRHPSMAKHPITPADESDLRMHLAKQTKKKIGLFDILALHRYQKEPFDITVQDQDIMLFDALEQDELATIGAIIDEMAVDEPLFSVGSSGIGMALGAHWQAQQSLIKPHWRDAEAGPAILVVSGSCSAITAEQIQVAVDRGFESIAVDTAELAGQIGEDFSTNSIAIESCAAKYAKRVQALLAAGKHVIVHTSIGTNDERLPRTDQIFREKKLAKTATAKLYGTLLGRLVNLVAAATEISRVVVAGGDTSSYAARAMGIEALEMIAPLSPGAPVCIANAPGRAVDKLQVIFKGGQVGKPDFFLEATKDIVNQKTLHSI